LHEATGWDELPPVVHAAARWERTLFDEGRGNWPVLGGEHGRERSYMLAWCNGAPGIALARLALPDALQTDGTREDARRALETTARAGLLPLDHLCCGNAGLAGALLRG